MDLIELRELEHELKLAGYRLNRWMRESVSPERAGAIKTRDRRRARLRRLAVERDALVLRLHESWEE